MKHNFEIAKQPSNQSPAQCGFIAARDHKEWLGLRRGK